MLSTGLRKLYDLVHCTDWQGDDLIKSSEP